MGFPTFDRKQNWGTLFTSLSHKQCSPWEEGTGWRASGPQNLAGPRFGKNEGLGRMRGCLLSTHHCPPRSQLSGSSAKTRLCHGRQSGSGRELVGVAREGHVGPLLPPRCHTRSTANTFTKVSSDWGSRLSEGQNPSPEQLRILQCIHLSCLYSLGSLLCLRPT